MRFLLTFALAFVCNTALSSITIEIDPGPVGSSFLDKTITFNDLDGVPFAGQTLEIDFVFSDMKHLKVDSPLSGSSGSRVYNVTLSFPGTVAYLGDFPGPFYLLDVFRENSWEPVSTNSAFPPAQVTGAYPIYDRNTQEYLPGHHGFHFQVTLPIVSHTYNEINSAEIRIRNSDHSGAITVGDGAVPEPASLLVWSCLGLFGTRRFRINALC